MVTPVSSFQNEEVLFFQDGKYIFITVDGIHTQRAHSKCYSKFKTKNHENIFFIEKYLISLIYSWIESTPPHVLGLNLNVTYESD